jgi:hypothetical protein
VGVARHFGRVREKSNLRRLTHRSSLHKLAAGAAVAAATLSLASAGAADPTPPWDPVFAAQTTIASFGGATRPFGLAAGDFDGDGKPDLVVGRTTGNVAFVKGNGDGTFAAPVVFAWKQAFFNAWAFVAGDVNGDGNLDVVWGANAASTGTTSTGVSVTVNDGEVRAFLGNGDGTFAESTYFVSGVRHNAGTLLADVGTDAGSLAAGDVDGDGDLDVVAGAVDGTNSVIRLLRDTGASYTVSTLVSQPANNTVAAEPIYWPASSTQNSPWGLSLSDADGDADADLWVGDRALYVYLFRNDGSGTFMLQAPNGAVSGRPNAYLGHDSFRAAVGFTPSLGSGDVNGDGEADLALGLQSGTQTPASGTAHDGEVLLDVSVASHAGLGAIADVGTMARGVTVVDVNGDGYRDVIAAEYNGSVKLLRQLPPLDSDSDGVSDYVDNAPQHANAARLDLNTDASVNYRDQLDNDFDTVLGVPEDQSTWQRLGDPADPDDDNDGTGDAVDTCPFVANPAQANADSDLFGDACDPLDGRDGDGDGVPDGPNPGDPLYDEHRAAKAKWSSGSTRIVLRIDALSRFFQNEFTQLMTDAATLSPEAWAVKCWENYGPGGGDPADPCGAGEGSLDQTVTLGGGKEVPISLVVIPRQLWTDPPVVDWINDRNDNPRLEIGQHGTDHPNNIPVSDWKDDPSRNWLSCETCGLTEAEVFQLLGVGRDMLIGNYANKWAAERGATPDSPKVDWSSSAQPLLTYAAPFNASDETARKAMAQLGFKAFSASRFEENGADPHYGALFTPGGENGHERFDRWGMFHASADVQLDPPDDLIADGDYSASDRAAFEARMDAQVNPGGLTTWLIEEVEWGGRACNDEERLVDCNGAPNREDNTVYAPRWEAWLHLLDFVKQYPDSVVMTLGEVALAQGYDNAPTAANPDQADADGDGIGDAVDGATLAAAAATLMRNEQGTLAATLTNGAGTAIPDQTVVFSFDVDGDGAAETATATTAADGTASVSVTPTRSAERTTFSVTWDGGRGVTAAGSAEAVVSDASRVVSDAANPTRGQVTDSVTLGATLTDSAGAPLSGRQLSFELGPQLVTVATDDSGHATATFVLRPPVGPVDLVIGFAGGELYSPSSVSAPFTVDKEDTGLALADAVDAGTGGGAVARATLTEVDGAPLAGATIAFSVEDGSGFVSLGAAVTDAAGVATLQVPPKYVSRTKRALRASFAGDASFLGSTASAFVYRVGSDTTAPAVSITSPASGASVSGVITIAADASDDIGVAGVEFRVDGVTIDGEDATAPYAVSWDTRGIGNGEHTVTAIARDAAGNRTTSAPVTVTVTNAAPPPPAGGLVAAYGFEEASGSGVVDSSGNGNAGTVSGAVRTGAGRFGAALSFDGVNDWVTVADAASLDLAGAMTLEAWVRPDVLGTAWRTVIGKDGSSRLAYGLYANTDTARPAGQVVIGGSEFNARGPAQLAVSVWTHLAATYDGASVRLYVDGSLAATLAVSGSMSATSGSLRIGGNGIWPEWFDGLIDEVRIYDRALTASEIQTDMNAPVGS